MYKFEDREFTQAEIDAGIAKLIEQIKDGADWDDDGDYLSDMAVDIYRMNFSKLDRDDKNFEIQQIIDKYVFNWATNAVTGNPNNYCTFINPNDHL